MDHVPHKMLLQKKKLIALYKKARQEGRKVNRRIVAEEYQLLYMWLMSKSTCKENLILLTVCCCHLHIFVHNLIAI